MAYTSTQVILITQEENKNYLIHSIVSYES